jgi:hypothetical protein
VAISVAWQTVVTGITTSANTTAYTVPSASTAAYGSYARDLVVTNSGTATVFACLNPAPASPSSVASFEIPVGGTLLLTQCAVPSAAILGLVTGAGTTSVSVGYATNVSYF